MSYRRFFLEDRGGVHNCVYFEILNIMNIYGVFFLEMYIALLVNQFIHSTNHGASYMNIWWKSIPDRGNSAQRGNMWITGGTRLTTSCRCERSFGFSSKCDRKRFEVESRSVTRQAAVCKPQCLPYRTNVLTPHSSERECIKHLPSFCSLQNILDYLEIKKKLYQTLIFYFTIKMQ